MRRLTMMAGALGVALLMSSGAFAQVPPPAPDYGPTVTLEQAQKAVNAALAEAKKTPYPMAITIVGPSGDLVYFLRMDGTQYASLAISQHKARVVAATRALC